MESAQKASKRVGVGVIGLDHPHWQEMTAGLVHAGAEVKAIHDRSSEKLEAFLSTYPKAKVAREWREVLNLDDVEAIVIAGVPAARAEVGLAAIERGKHAFVDKPSFIRREDLLAAEEAVRRTGRRWAVYYGELYTNPPTVVALEAVRRGAIGDAVNLVGLGPHRVGKGGRPGWFYDSQQSGGILVDIASHQVVQVLAFSGSSRATVVGASVRREELHGRSSFQVLGEGWLQTESGCTAYIRVDWLTPDGLRSWGDGRLFVLGTAGTIEVRKNLDLAGDPRGRVLLVDEEGERELPVHGDEGEAYFAALLAQFCGAQPPDETACKLEFEAARLSLALQEECPKVAQF